MDEVSESAAIYLLIYVTSVNLWINRWFEIQYDSSTDYADYKDEMNQNQLWRQILLQPQTLLFLPRGAMEKKI